VFHKAVKESCTDGAGTGQWPESLIIIDVIVIVIFVNDIIILCTENCCDEGW